MDKATDSLSPTFEMGYIKKQRIPENLNQMPPGEMIDDQENAEINEMTLKTITPSGYKGDGY